MTRDQYDDLSHVENVKETMSPFELTNQEDRTLIWGYTVDRESFHLYIKDGSFHLLIYRGGLTEDTILRGCNMKYLYAKDCVPSKRIYPEACDYEFCKLLRQKGVILPFTVWNKDREPKQYYGEVVY